MHRFRTHKCGELNTSSIGKLVKVSGWIHRKRNHGGIYFIDLRDYFGIIQTVISYNNDNKKNLNKETIKDLLSLNYESIVTIEGKVVKRSLKTINSELSTGKVEIYIYTYKLESQSNSLPINVNSIYSAPEDLRLQYRFLDLRRDKMQQNIRLRSEVIKFLRVEMWSRDFIELQTPILTSSSPEGARDFLVPSRLNKGSFYALPQAPQQFKQLYMMSGFDKYFQIAPCFRDEDARSDRAPGEFYQLDIEMSFITQEEIFKLTEEILSKTFKKFSNYRLPNIPFPRITYSDSMIKYGSDKPDLRNPIVINDVTHVFQNSKFNIFFDGIKNSKVIRAIPVHGCGYLKRSFYDKIIQFSKKELKSSGLGYIYLDKNNILKGSLAKFLSESEIIDIKKKCVLNMGDSVFFICDKEKNASLIAGKIRDKIGQDLNLIKKNEFHFCWIVDYPFYKFNEKNNRLEFFHNPFSMPQGGLEALNKAEVLADKLTIKAYQYDIVCNGVEISSGAIRNHQLITMYKAFSAIKYSEAQVNKMFPGITQALRYGAPPHGGIAPGIDRMLMLLSHEENIREIIAFPLNQKAQNTMMRAPSSVNEQALLDLGLLLPKNNKL